MSAGSGLRGADEWDLAASWRPFYPGQQQQQQEEVEEEEDEEDEGEEGGRKEPQSCMVKNMMRVIKRTESGEKKEAYGRVSVIQGKTAYCIAATVYFKYILHVVFRVFWPVRCLRESHHIIPVVNGIPS
jgi:hypothetical protein